jgi:hypothetical protein
METPMMIHLSCDVSAMKTPIVITDITELRNASAAASASAT